MSASIPFQETAKSQCDHLPLSGKASSEQSVEQRGDYIADVRALEWSGPVTLVEVRVLSDDQPTEIKPGGVTCMIGSPANLTYCWIGSPEIAALLKRMEERENAKADSQTEGVAIEIDAFTLPPSRKSQPNPMTPRTLAARLLALPEEAQDLPIIVE